MVREVLIFACFDFAFFTVLVSVPFCMTLLKEMKKKKNLNFSISSEEGRVLSKKGIVLTLL